MLRPAMGCRSAEGAACCAPTKGDGGANRAKKAGHSRMRDLAMSAPLACTIIANNYLAYARAFTRSFLAQQPEGRVCVLIVDLPQPGHRYEDEPFAVVFADQLGIPSFPHVSFRYSILELSTAVKPYFLLHLHRTFGCDRVCYFDPDILVLGDLAGLYERLGQADVV